jgi:hypothetical protein
LRPSRSDIFPKGISRTADARRKDIGIQLSITAFIENSSAISGRAILMAAERKEITKEVNPTT